MNKDAATATSTSPMQGLLPSSFWNENFKEAYEKKGKLVNEHFLKFLMALDQPEETVKNIIRVTKKEQLNTRFGPHRLSALAIAVLKGKASWVEGLLKREGIEVNIKDKYGWTPLHYSALLETAEIYNTLLEHGAESTAKTCLGATAEDLQKLMGKTQVIHNPNVIIELNEERIPIEKAERVLQEVFPRLKRYSDEVIYPASHFTDLWMQKKIVNPMIEASYPLTSSYHDMLRNPPQLCIKEDEEMSKKLGSPFWSLVAGEDLAAGTVIAEYTGIFNPVKDDKSPLERAFANFSGVPFLPYALDNIDAEEITGAASFANCGWPKCVMVKIFNERGLAERSVLYVIDPNGIKAGEPIYWDYLKSPALKWGFYQLSEREEMQSFFSVGVPALLKTASERIEEFTMVQTPIVEKYLRAQLSEKPITKKKSVPDQVLNPVLRSYYEYKTKLLYPLHTPAALLYLTCSGVVTPEDWEILRNESWVAEEFSKHNPSHRICTENIIKSLKVFMDALKDTGDFKIKALDFVIDQIGKLTIMQLWKGILLIELFALKKKSTSLEPLNLEDWNVLKAFLLEFLPTYEFKDDPIPPIRLK